MKYFKLLTCINAWTPSQVPNKKGGVGWSSGSMTPEGRWENCIVINTWSLNNYSLLIINTKHVEHTIEKSLPYITMPFCFIFSLKCFLLHFLFCTWRVGREGKTGSTEENREIVIGEVEREVIRELRPAPSIPATSVWDLKRGGWGAGTQHHWTRGPRTMAFTEAYHRRVVSK